MRVITGSAKSIPLISLDRRTVPLSDRAKGALFNIIQEKIQGSTVLDLYAGSGALGIEAISRGAAFATFIDISTKAIESIQENLAKTKLSEHATVIRKDAMDYVKRNSDTHFDIIFICPPYHDIHFYAVECASEMLNPFGLLIFEHHKKDIFKQPPNLSFIEKRTYGIVQFEIYQRL